MWRWRAGPCCLLLAAACALGRPPPPSVVRCQPGGACFSAHLANASYDEARSACGSWGGGLAWVSAESELGPLLALLAEVAAGPALFWVGLKRNASACTDTGQPLRGFSWEERGEAAPREVPSALGRWAKEPVRTCTTARCAGLHLTGADSPRWGWRELPCQRHGRGYACRYREEGACPDLRPDGALSLDYRLPFGKGSTAPGFSPPGTELAVACPGGEVLLRCRHGPGGFAWEGAEEPDCLCKERCAATPSAAADHRLSAPSPGDSAGPPATSPAGRGGTAAPPHSASSSSNYVFILVTVAVVVLVILVMTVLGVFRLCFNTKAAGGGDKEPAAGGGEAETGGAEPRGAAGTE
ncbi:C-type lectin domain family 14 member A [Coturnix japonica]|uniref:C-type lectin domain containing 14A n=1 Tax=Coturnix japonica TaxID=93934 RepID=A0A8C2UA64_COTJA|nr:C-type lectin domain family 14 member A [Coturnix japonica]